MVSSLVHVAEPTAARQGENCFGALDADLEEFDGSRAEITRSGVQQLTSGRIEYCAEQSTVLQADVEEESRAGLLVGR